MNNNPRIRPYPNRDPLAIAAGEEHPISRGGTFLRVRTADQKFRIVFDDRDEVIAEINDVFEFTDASFKKVTVVNDSAYVLNFQLEIGDGSIKTNKISIVDDIKIRNANAPNDVLAAQEKRASTLNDPIIEAIFDGAASREILAENADRINCLVRNLSSIYTAYLGTAAVQLIPLAPNEVLDLSGTTYALHAVNNDGADVDLLIIEDE
ncbi:MAG: hypothetical protein COB36_11070 [Alphaproteobacteria bacterium]|nr:MAG: hypothetical protein COB36_11070 [Alphaproteobacteria bacterium]